MIKASVLLPMFRSKHIAWVQLESLCRQVRVDFEWELLIAEELHDETLGEALVRSYETRLESVGCTRLQYTPVRGWITLGAKWKMLLLQTSPSSALFFPSAADIYSAPQRLSRLHRLFLKYPDGDWFIPATAIDYDILTGKAVMRDMEQMRTLNKPDIAGFAAAGSLLRQAAALFKVDQMITLVDGKIWAYCKQIRPQGMKIIRDYSAMWKYGLNVNGLGNISDRTDVFSLKIGAPWVPYPNDLARTIPKDVLNRLKGCAQFVPHHTRKVPP